MLEAGDDETARSLVNQLVERFPNEIKAWSLHGHIYAQARDFAQATTDLTRAIEINAMEPSLFFDRGRYELEQGEFQSAIRDFSKALELCDYYKNDYYRELLHFMRAEAFCLAGMKVEAIQDLGHVRDDLQAWTYKLRTKAQLLRDVNRLPGTSGPQP